MTERIDWWSVQDNSLEINIFYPVHASICNYTPRIHWMMLDVKDHLRAVTSFLGKVCLFAIDREETADRKQTHRHTLPVLWQQDTLCRKKHKTFLKHPQIYPIRKKKKKRLYRDRTLKSQKNAGWESKSKLHPKQGQLQSWIRWLGDFAQSARVPAAVPPHVQDFRFSFADLDEAPASPFLQPVGVALNDRPCPHRVSWVSATWSRSVQESGRVRQG